MSSSYFSDLHIHVGRDWKGKPVKITGSKNLTLTEILKTASRRKGIDLVGVIDAHAPRVQEELIDLIDRGYAIEVQDGGVQFESTLLILGSEIEILDKSCNGPIHVLCYLPTLKKMREFSDWLAERMTNIHLSSQRFYGSGRELQEKIQDLGGLFIPAHIFTPFKSLYGKGVHKSISEVLDVNLIDAVELGLSSDTEMADGISELHSFPFLTNSDAHSAGKIAREYQELQLNTLSFEELKKALKGEEGRRILGNYGMDPKLGKYHQTVCSACFWRVESTNSACKNCGSKKIVKGVSDRIKELSSHSSQPKRPPYIYQVPLDYLPGVGKKTYEKLLDAFQTEMAVLHDTSLHELSDVVPQQVAQSIIAMRSGQLTIEAGGGGVYGKVSKNLS
ncbi:endonuclease Q family protein [Halobacillus sp. Marseille-Q1614]|uniref:endonuclease Q family protein n=1 Tax=Halobacillus sp. Marseille-Q1614 TaxID=2709134 RepID=UPI00156F2929|nr:endonuclease Q family protein [Halobacillus sp. Marseille-Q1614]